MVYQWRFLQKASIVPKTVSDAVGGLFGRILSSSPPEEMAKTVGATLELQRQEVLDRQEQALIDARRTYIMNNAGVRPFILIHINVSPGEKNRSRNDQKTP